MRLGMSMSSTSRLPARDAGRHLLRRVRTARDAGLHTLSFGDSHARAEARYFQNTPTLARALAEWDPLRAAGCLFLLPMWPPVLVAEQVGTLATLHDGPFVLQTGLGGGAASMRAVGAPVRHRGAALDEAIRVIRALFDGETVTSEMFGIEGASVDLVPPDGVQWWIGAASDAGVRRAGRWAATWYAAHGTNATNLPRLADLYRSSFDGREGAAPAIALRRDVIVLRDGERAQRLADDLLAAGYRGLPADGLVAGTADRVAETLAPYGELGVDEIVVRTAGVSPDVDIETIEQLARVRSWLG